MPFPSPEKAYTIIEKLHLLRYSDVVNQPFFSTGMSFLFLFGVLAAMTTFALVASRKDRYYFGVSLLCFIISGLFIYAPIRRVNLSIPGEKVLAARAEKAMKGFEIIEKRTMKLLWKEEKTAIDASGPTEEEALRSAIGSAFDSILQLKGHEGFGSLQDGTQQEIISGSVRLLTVQRKEKTQDGVALHCLLDAREFRKFLEARGYAAEPLRMTIRIGKNGTDLENEELHRRVSFLLKKESRYYINGGFHATPEALSDEFGAMELKLGGRTPSRIAVGSVRQSPDGSYIFTVDVL